MNRIFIIIIVMMLRDYVKNVRLFGETPPSPKIEHLEPVKLSTWIIWNVVYFKIYLVCHCRNFDVFFPHLFNLKAAHHVRVCVWAPVQCHQFCFDAILFPFPIWLYCCVCMCTDLMFWINFTFGGLCFGWVCCRFFSLVFAVYCPCRRNFSPPFV